MSDKKSTWEQEHIQQDTFAVMHTNRPSQPIPQFIDFLKEGREPGAVRVLDLGCGKGRNTLYLAQHGFRVTGVDFSERAIADARARTLMFQHQIDLHVVDITQEWPFNDAEFDAVIDCTTSVFIPEPGRQFMIDEAYHVLKNGGYYLFYGYAEQEHTHMNSLTEKGLGADHLKREAVESLFSRYHLVSLDMILSHDSISGAEVDITMWVGIFQKM